ncbi:uncharacterized protein LOC112562602 [Pomacea canaliculata]|uniref:uncharacterized protein LOC112562602 n=1 Tax=Pomacea canaliculata TaxID=400727 RepID=UPI000D73C1CE|nr:uncharacterized protein LOC112562602 [Pomacea canaliculata]
MFQVLTIADAKESSSPVVAAVVSCVGALCVVVAVVVGFLLLRRKQQSQGVRTEDSAICCSAAANPDDRQNSFHVYDRLSREHRRADNDKEPGNTPDKRSKDDEYTYIDEATIIKMTGRLDEDHQPATTATEQPTNANPGSGLHPDLSPLYRLAGAVNNGFTDSQPPDYFILETDENRCAEPTQYFILEERDEKKSPADTDTQQYFTLEEGQEGAGRCPPASGADYFELERHSDRQSDCAGVARHEESRGPPEDAEYSRLEPNGLEHSEYSLLTHPAHQASTVGDNPYSLASGVE